MTFTLYPILGVVIIIFAFIAEFFDSTIGMGYGTLLAPILLLMGFDSFQVVPAILLSEFVTGILAAYFHHKLGNVDFHSKIPEFIIHIFNKKIRSTNKNNISSKISLDLKIAAILSICSIFGTIAAIIFAIKISQFWLNLYISIMIIFMSLLILIRLNRVTKFSWRKLILVSAMASFNKGVSGGGYGPLVTSGQLFAGINAKKAVAITSFAEALTCFVGITTYFILKKSVDWILLPYLLIGAIIAVPLATLTVKNSNTETLTHFIGTATLIEGIILLIKVIH
ncbi:MAG: sulfite exporter TauE/SafE family protein [Candidatus Woesearchaeota archaeon]